MTENDIKNSVIGFFAHLSDFSVLRRKIISCRFYKIHCVLRGRPPGKPQVFFENIVVAPTGFGGFLNVIPVGEDIILPKPP